MATPKQEGVASSLAVGDRIEIFRNLEHPVNMVRVEGEYGTHYQPDPAVIELIGDGTVTESTTSNWGSNSSWSNEPRTEVRISGGFWYGEDGLQVGSGATYIVKAI